MTSAALALLDVRARQATAASVRIDRCWPTFCPALFSIKLRVLDFVFMISSPVLFICLVVFVLFIFIISCGLLLGFFCLTIGS